MRNLINKELKLMVHPMFYTVLLLSALILIPNWLYFMAMAYVFFISISNIFLVSKSNNDMSFSAMLPVRKRDIVRARYVTIIFIEMTQIIAAIIFAILNQKLYPNGNFFMEPNIAFFGFVFIMYAIFNSIMMPMFYKTGYKVGIPVVLGTIVALLFATIVEYSIKTIESLNLALDSSNPDMLIWKILVLVIGIAIYIISNIITCRISSKNFEKIDL